MDDDCWRDLYAEYVKDGFTWEEIDHLWDSNPAQEAAPDVWAQYRYLKNGDVLSYGGHELRCILTPGHTPGGVTYFDAEHGLAFTGDTLFAGSAGRTDLLGGDQGALFASLARLGTLPPETRVYPGHGPASTIGEELRENPFLRHAMRG